MTKNQKDGNLPGMYFIPKLGTWRVDCKKFNGDRVFIGYFPKRDDAVAALENSQKAPEKVELPSWFEMPPFYPFVRKPSATSKNVSSKVVTEYDDV